MKNTVLIVEDAPLYQEFLKNIVGKLGYQPVACGDGLEAMDYLKQQHDHLKAVFLDIYMPQVDGISTLGHIRTNYPEVPVIIITGSEDSDDERSAIGLGAIGYIKKPFPPATIVESIRALLMGADTSSAPAQQL